MTKRAYITGINGQDGIFLSKLLVGKGYEVAGCGSQYQPSTHLPVNVKYNQLDITRTFPLLDSVKSFNPTEIYNLASVSSVAHSFQKPVITRNVNFEAVINFLEKLEECGLLQQVKFFQASSSEMFGLAKVEPQDETVTFNPLSPYAHSKVDALEVCRRYRSQGVFISSGIMFNHESIYRPPNFVTRKITQGVAAIKQGKVKSLKIGNIHAERDWGYAGDFVEAMWAMLQVPVPDDFVVATGLSHSVKQLVSIAFDEVGLYGKEFEYIELDPELLRPSEVNRLVGNPSKARRILGWESKKSFENLIREMVRYDLHNLE